MIIRLYCPSNGTEGDLFIERFCFNCVKFQRNSGAKKKCHILSRATSHDVDDLEYPIEWQYVDGKPTCTAFKDRDQFNAERRANRKPSTVKFQDGDMFGETA